MNIKNIDTPALIVDAKILKENICAMNDLLSGSNMKLRPHYKSHKCSYLAHLQIENGAKGLTCAKLSEAIDLADSGIEDILIANQITDIDKIYKMASLAKSCHLTVCVDDTENIRNISKAASDMGSTVHCLVEYEIGMERCGVKEKEEVLTLAKEIEKSDNVTFDGLQIYAGHISHVVDFCEREKLTNENAQKIKELISYLNENGIDVKIVSGGSTGTCQIKKDMGIYNELQAGSYLFMDNTYKDLNLPFKNSLFVLTSVVSKKDNLTVVDAGVKTCGVDQGMPGILNNEAEKIVASEEHFQLHNLKNKVNIGDKMLLIPGHCCSTVNLYDKIYVVEDGKVNGRIFVTARGFGK